MKTVSFTEFRKNASALFSAVEDGETFHVMRHGKVIAEIGPIHRENAKQPSWKKRGLKLSVQGDSLSKIILEERIR